MQIVHMLRQLVSLSLQAEKYFAVQKTSQCSEVNREKRDV